MTEQAKLYPFYDWEKNKGYPTKKHYAGIAEHGICELHRRSYNLKTSPNPSQGGENAFAEGEFKFGK